MNKTRRSATYLLIAVTLLFLVLFLFACNEQDFFDQYGALTATDPAATVAAPEGGVVDPVTTEESGDAATGETADDAPVVDTEETGKDTDKNTEEDGTDKDPVSDPDVETTKTSDPNEETTKTTDPDAETTKTSDPDDTASDPPAEEDQTETTDTEDTPTEEEEQEVDLSLLFDLSVEADGLYRIILTEEGSYPVFVGVQSVGSVSLSADGEITFDCGFTQTTCELWGNYDDDGHLLFFVRFEALDGGFRRLTFTPSAEAIQLDLTAEELVCLRLSGEEETEQPATPPEQDVTSPEGSGAPQTSEPTSDPDDAGEEQDPDDPAEEESESLPADSAFLFLWEGVGTVKNVEVVVMSDSEEEYSFVLSGTAEECSALMARLTPYLTFTDATTTPRQYQATVVLEGKVANVFLYTVGEGAPTFLAEVKVIGEAL